MPFKLWKTCIRSTNYGTSRFNNVLKVFSTLNLSRPKPQCGWLHLSSLQIAISNPNREVLLTLSRSNVIELIGKEWYFVRVHDAVQVCLQHVQGLKDTAKTSDPLPDVKPSLFQRLLKQRGEDESISNLESGNQQSATTEDTDPQLEPLLSRKS